MRFVSLEWTDPETKKGEMPTLHRQVLELWATDHVKETDTERMLRIFHVPFSQAPKKGRTLSYLGTKFIVVSVSDSKKLQGLELICAQVHEERPVDETAAYREYLRKLAS